MRLEIDHWIEDILVALVSLRIFILHFISLGLHPAETYIRYITKLSDRAPHLEYFTADGGFGRKIHCKRVNRKWVECDVTQTTPFQECLRHRN
jgi:hypothetical protein